MFTDDSRGLESPDRSDASTANLRVCTDGGERTSGECERNERDPHRDAKRSERGSRSSSELRSDGGEPTRSIRECLEIIDHLTRTLHVDIQHQTNTELEGVDDDTRQEAARRIREIRATVGQVGLELLGPEASIPYWPPEAPEHDSTIACSDGSVATTYSGPAPEALERELERRREYERDGTDVDERDETDDDEQDGRDDASYGDDSHHDGTQDDDRQNTDEQDDCDDERGDRNE